MASRLPTITLLFLIATISLISARDHRSGNGKKGHQHKKSPQTKIGSMSAMGSMGPEGEGPPCHACEEHAKRMKNFKCIAEYPHFLGPCVPTQLEKEKEVEIFGLLCPASFICLVNNGIDFGCCGKKKPTRKQLRQEKQMSKKQFTKLMKRHRQMVEQPMEPAGQGPLGLSGAGPSPTSQLPQGQQPTAGASGAAAVTP